jgi:hypothetical protein
MNWVAHARQSPGAGAELLDAMHRFLATSQQGKCMRVNWLLSLLLELDDGHFAKECATDRTDMHLLHMACWFGLEFWVQRLVPEDMSSLQRHQLLQRIDVDGRLPLYYAIEQNYPGIMAILLERGTIPNLLAFEAAILPGKNATRALLIRYGKSKTAQYELDKDVLDHSLFEAIAERHWGAARLLLDAGADPKY